MNEVEKMYENAESDRNCNLYKHFTECPMKHTQCEDCENFVYPPFTAEKQLEIFKMFCRRYLEVSQHVEENGDLCFGIKATVGDYGVGFNKDFAECLADFVNSLWQDLTEEERKQVKGILE